MSAANPRERCDALSSSKQRVGLQNREIALAQFNLAAPNPQYVLAANIPLTPPLTSNHSDHHGKNRRREYHRNNKQRHP
ncbi:hypothetical protein CG403_04330 [Gardnerella vaginalis]|nr:hypothetical protein CG403_04330 [Gardnerella vaginalis]